MMNLKEVIKDRFKGERLISLFSLIIGLFLLLHSFPLIIAYHFYKGILWYFMYPMVTLVLEFMLGILLMISSRLITKQDYPKASILNRLIGILIILAPLNFYILNKIQESYYEEWFLMFLLPYGILLILFFYQKKYTKNISKILYSLLIYIILAIAIYTISNLAFFNWQYY